jgi:hypothetical protein
VDGLAIHEVRGLILALLLMAQDPEVDRLMQRLGDGAPAAR